MDEHTLMIHDTMADFAAETALAEAANNPSITDHNETSVQDGDNKFQKAISAWRSRQFRYHLLGFADF